MDITVIYATPWNLVLFLVAVALLPWRKEQGNSNVLVAAAVFLVWNVGYIFDSAHLAGRTPTEVLDAAHGARDYMRWIFPTYGVLLGAVLAIGQPKQKAIFDAFQESKLPAWLFIAPLVIATVLLLFVPIQLVDASGSPTNALKAHLFILVYGEQMVVFIFAHVLLKLLWYVFPDVDSLDEKH